jgi:hypothetical protein
MSRLFILIFVCMVLFSCRKEDNKPVEEYYKSADFFVKFKEGSNIREYRQTVGNVIVDAISIPDNNIYREFCRYSKSTSNVQESFTIVFSKIYYTSTPLPEQLDSLFGIRRYTDFGPETSVRAVAAITWIDSNGIQWSTRNTGTNQSGSYVNITYSIPAGGLGYRYTVKGSFFCTLYNNSNQAKEISSGEFTGKFGAGNF